MKPIAQRAARTGAQTQAAGEGELHGGRPRAGAGGKSAGSGEGDVTDTGDEISFRRAGVQDGVMRKLKRGEYRVEEVCDLHGLRVDEAKAALREFLAESLRAICAACASSMARARAPGPRGPVLKTAVNMILRKTGPVWRSPPRAASMAAPARSMCCCRNDGDSS